MKDIKTTCKIALVQAEPVMFSKSASLKKALQYICEAASQKPDLIVFPELFIPGYPVGMNFGFSMGKRSDEGRKDWKRYYDASVVAGDSLYLMVLTHFVPHSQRQPKKRRHTSALDFPSETLLVERSTTAMSFLNRTGHIRYTES